MSPGSTRIVRVCVNGGPAWGLVDDGVVVHLPDGPFTGELRPGESLGAVDELEPLAPVTPSKIICVARNYVAHAAEHEVEVPEKPLLFLKPPSAVIGPRSAIVLPTLSERVEHEGELAVVIGRRCRHVRRDDAWSAVLGLSCANDVTARDIQRSEKLWTRGKGFDTFCPVGPWVVTGIDEAVAMQLRLRCWVDDELRQNGRTGDMVFTPSFLISYISRVMTLEPGDVILTGTPAGVGPLAAGQTVTVAIEAIGELVNSVESEAL